MLKGDKQNIKQYEFKEIHQLRGNNPFSNGFNISKETHRKGEDAGFMFPFRTDHHIVILVLRGNVEVEWNLNFHILKSKDLISISGNMVTQSINFLEDSTAIIITFTKEYALENTQKSRALESFKLLSATASKKVSLNEKEYDTFLSISSYLFNQDREDQNNHLVEKLKHAFNLIFFELSGLYEKYHPLIPISINRKEELSGNFIKLLGANFREERSVNFYAKSLYVTPGHLSKVLKQVSGKSARELIDQAVILEAKILLNNRALLIAQITDDLNFSDQSFFGKFFKKETGLSPRAYRRTLS